jgi:hypothetical protein
MKNFKIEIKDPKRAEAFKVILKELGFEEKNNVFASITRKTK